MRRNQTLHQLLPAAYGAQTVGRWVHEERQQEAALHCHLRTTIQTRVPGLVDLSKPALVCPACLVLKHKALNPRARL
jgi:hypothetical protein